jgi:hypothetical protein
VLPHCEEQKWIFLAHTPKDAKDTEGRTDSWDHTNGVAFTIRSPNRGATSDSWGT